MALWAASHPIEMGVLPVVTSATVSCMILFTSAAATLGLIILGTMPLGYGCFLFAYGMFWTAIGSHTITTRLQLPRHQSIVVLSIGLTILVSIFAMGYQSWVRWREDPEGAGRFGSLCG